MAARAALLHPASGVTAVRGVSTLAYPFKLSKSAVQLNVPCRYSKLHVWNMTEYGRVVLLDADTMLLRNVDELFEHEEPAAVADVAGAVNTGVMVLEPRRSTFLDMLALYPTAPSYNRGDQGFISWYFLEHLGRSVEALPAQYNVVTRYSEHSGWEQLRATAKVVHFTADAKPWTFYRTPDKLWLRNLDGELFYLWLLHWCAVHQQVRGRPLNDLSQYKLKAPRLLQSRGHATIAHLKASQSACGGVWKHKLRIGLFSVVLGSAASSGRVEAIKLLILHYRQSRFVDRIYLSWPNASVPTSLKDMFKPKDALLAPVVLVRQSVDSPNSRFSPIAGLRTRAVFVCSDDMRARIPIGDLDQGFKTWQANQQQLVGFFPRSHWPEDEQAPVEYIPNPRGIASGYSMMAADGVFLDSLFLHIYTCLLPPHLHAYINVVRNCEDILLNMMVSGMTGLPPLAVESAIESYEHERNGNYTLGLQVRSACMIDLQRMLGHDTLRYNDQLVSTFRQRVKSRKRPSRKANASREAEERARDDAARARDLTGVMRAVTGSAVLPSAVTGQSSPSQSTARPRNHTAGG